MAKDQHLPKMPNGNNQHSSVKLFDNSLLTLQELAAQLSVPLKTIRDWVYKRRIPFQKVGKHIRFRPSEIEHWLQTQRSANAHQDD